MGAVLLLLLIVLLFASVPAYPYSRGWGYYPSSGVGLLLAVLIILLLMGIVPWGIGPGPVAPVGPVVP